MVKILISNIVRKILGKLGILKMFCAYQVRILTFSHLIKFYQFETFFFIIVVIKNWEPWITSHFYSKTKKYQDGYRKPKQPRINFSLSFFSSSFSLFLPWPFFFSSFSRRHLGLLRLVDGDLDLSRPPMPLARQSAPFARAATAPPSPSRDRLAQHQPAPPLTQAH